MRPPLHLRHPLPRIASTKEHGTRHALSTKKRQHSSLDADGLAQLRVERRDRLRILKRRRARAPDETQPAIGKRRVVRKSAANVVRDDALQQHKGLSRDMFCFSRLD